MVPAVIAFWALLAAPAEDQNDEEIRRLMREGRYADAETAARVLLSDEEAAHGAESLQAAEALDQLVPALQWGGKGRSDESRRLAERAVVIKEKALGLEHPGVAYSLNNLGSLLFVRGEYDDARARLERALAIGEKALGPGDPVVASSLFRLGGVLEAKGEFPQSVALQQRALAIQEKALGPDSLEVAQTLNSLASVQRSIGDHPAALASRERCLAIRLKALGHDHPQVAWAMHNFANLLMDMGDLPRAETLYEEALAIRKKALPPDHPDLGYSYNSLGLVLQSLGDYAGSRVALERSLAIREKAFGPEHPQVAFGLNNLGMTLLALGDLTGARSLFERSLQIKEKVSGPDHPDTARSVNNLALVLDMTGDLAGARRLYERALGIREKALAPDHPAVATSLVDVGDLLRSTGELAAARPLLERALRIREKVLSPDHHHIAESLHSFANLLAAGGEARAARPLYGRALGIREKALGPAHPEVASLLNDLARVQWSAGEALPAMQSAVRAETIGREHFRQTARRLAEREALGYQRIRYSGLDVILSILGAAAPPSRPEGWAAGALDQLVRSRAMVLEEMVSRRRVAADSGAAEVASRFRELGLTRNRLARLALDGPDPDHPERYLEQLGRAQQEKERAERALAERSLRFRQDLDRRRVTLTEIRKALPGGSALVSIALYREAPKDRAAGVEGEPTYVGFVLRPGTGAPAVVPLGQAEAIDRLVGAWSHEAAEGARGPSAAGRRAEASYREAGERLRRALWDPLSGALGGARQVFVVPDGPIHLVNLAALPDEAGGYMIETGPLIHYLAAERDLLRTEPQGPRGEGMLVLGGPDFGGGTGAGREARREAEVPCGDFVSLHFAALQAAKIEADEIGALWPDGRVEKLAGAGATEAAFKRSAPGRRVLHLATHAFFLDGRCAPDLVSDNPLLLSGLALAGANRRRDAAGGGSPDDGLLSAEEIAAMDLSGVEWAVLSACETGAGRVQAGEGVLGLRRAFESAGASTLIMSLWSVRDAAAREWMKELYRGRLAGASTAEAVRTASVKLLRELRRTGRSTHPFYWGAFVASGDWR